MWYHLQISQIQKEYGEDHTNKKITTIHSEGEHDPFALRDSTGQILIQPNPSAIDAVRKTVDRRGATYDGPGSEFARSPDGYMFEEWLIPQGQRLCVLGQVNKTFPGEEPCLEGTLLRSTGTRLLISTRTAQEILRAGRRLAPFHAAN